MLCTGTGQVSSGDTETWNARDCCGLGRNSRCDRDQPRRGSDRERAQPQHWSFFGQQAKSGSGQNMHPVYGRAKCLPMLGAFKT